MPPLMAFLLSNKDLELGEVKIKIGILLSTCKSGRNQGRMNNKMTLPSYRDTIKVISVLWCEAFKKKNQLHDVSKQMYLTPKES